MHRVQLYLEHRTLRLNQTYTYLADDHVVAGMRVKVDFGHQSLVGFVVKTDAHHEEDVLEYELKPIQECLDDGPVLNQELIELALWMSKETCAPVVTCFQAMLPKINNIKSSAKALPKERWVSRHDLGLTLTPKQQAAYDDCAFERKYADLKKNHGSCVDTLIKKGVLILSAKDQTYLPQHIERKPAPHRLSLDQSAALDLIRHSQKPVCLFGATGSGKTEIYLALAQEALDRHQQALICVPEIGLTPQMVARVKERFGQDVIVYHSHLSAKERFLQYQRVKAGEKTVVVGTRSAIFLPFTQCSLFVLDEEHDGSYKQESHPRYHTRDIALKRAQTHQATLILGSATPSFETYARALKGVYQLVTLKERVKGVLPKIAFVTPAKGQRGLLAEATRLGIQQRLDAHQQVIILLNRRGYAPILQCMECGKAIECPSCDRLLHVHRDEGLMKCHSCGHQVTIPTQCPNCQSRHLRMLGVGTQRLEEELHLTFPQARLLRLDKDSTQAKEAHTDILSAFEAGEADILLGTQMIAKGLDIPKVTLSVVLEIDQSLLRPDYRSVEDAFDLLVQTAGRSGRSHQTGEVIVQTRLPDHYAFKFAKDHDFDAFFRHEMRFRQLGQNPPYTYLVAVTLSADVRELALQPLSILMERFDAQTKVLGPADLGKLQNRYRARLILKGKDLDALRAEILRLLPEVPMHAKTDWVIDVNPRSLF